MTSFPTIVVVNNHCFKWHAGHGEALFRTFNQTKVILRCLHQQYDDTNTMQLTLPEIRNSKFAINNKLVMRFTKFLFS